MMMMVIIKPDKILKVFTSAHTSNQWKHCDYVIYG